MILDASPDGTDTFEILGLWLSCLLSHLHEDLHYGMNKASGNITKKCNIF